jgi:hypothetical protein
MIERIRSFRKRIGLQTKEERRRFELGSELYAEFSRLGVSERLDGLQKDVWTGGSVSEPRYDFSSNGGRIIANLSVSKLVWVGGSSRVVDTMPGAGYWIGDRFQTVSEPGYFRTRVVQRLSIVVEVDNEQEARKLLLCSNYGSADKDKGKPSREFVLTGDEDDLRVLQEALDEDIAFRLAAGLIPVSETEEDLDESN